MLWLICAFITDQQQQVAAESEEEEEYSEDESDQELSLSEETTRDREESTIINDADGTRTPEESEGDSGNFDDGGMPSEVHHATVGLAAPSILEDSSVQIPSNLAAETIKIYTTEDDFSGTISLLLENSPSTYTSPLLKQR